MPTNPTSGKQEPLRIAQLIETMAMGGAEHLAVRIANRLAAEGHQSHLIVLRGPGDLSSRIGPDVHVHYLDFERASISNPLAFAVSLRRGLRLIRRVVDEGNISVVQTHLPGANFFGLLLAWRRACAVLATVHNNQEFRYGDSDNVVLYRLRKWAYRRLLLAGQGVVAVSQEVKDSLVGELGIGSAVADKISVLTNAVEIPAGITAGRRSELRGQLGFRTGEVALLAAGRFCEQKNFLDLIPVACHLRENSVPFHLVAAGEGEQRAEFLARAQEAGLGEAVSAPGLLSNLGEVMQAVDLFVMTSRWEGLPLVLLEAMAAGLPTVSYRIAGVEEVVVDGVSGLTAPVGDTRELARHLARLVASEQERGKMGQAGLARIKDRFGFAEYLESLMRLYAAAAASQAART